MNRFQTALLASLFASVVALSGCGPSKDSAQKAPEASPANANDEIAAERAKLSPEDRALVEAQEWCVVSTDERLGSMGEPMKLSIKGQPVFVCCGGCKRKAEADPDATLAKLAELKAKKAKQ